MLHGKWTLMNIIIIRGREALRPKQASLSLSLSTILHCKSAPALSRLRENEEQKKINKKIILVSSELCERPKKGKISICFKAFLFNKFLCPFRLGNTHNHLLILLYKIICAKKWRKKKRAAIGNGKNIKFLWCAPRW